MATITLSANNYNNCQASNYDILNENGDIVGKDGTWDVTTTNKSFKIKAKDNYSFNPLNDETPKIDFSGFSIYVRGVGRWYCGTGYTLTYNDDYTIITVTLNSGDMYDHWGNWSAQFRVSSDVKATATKVLQNFTITENLTNAVSDNTDTTILEGANKTITFSPSPSNYRFDTTQSICNTGEFTLNVERLVIWSVENVNTDVEISVVALPPLTYYSVTDNLTNVSSDNNNPVRVEENTNFTLIYHANNGYTIDTLTCNIGNVVISDDKLTATVTGIATENITVTATGKEMHYVYVTGTFNNCICNYENGEIIDINKPVVIKANSGFDFKGVSTYKKGNATNAFAKNEDNTELYIKKVSFTDNYDYYINGVYSATKTSELVSGFVNLYRVTNTELKALSKTRFVNVEGTTVDYGEFITQLYVLPFEISRDIIGEQNNIILGNYDSKVESTMLIDSKLYINGGLITVPNKYNNVYDYLNTTCTLRLPFFNPIIIDVDNVIGKTLTIQFIVDLYSGNCTATITSSFTGEIIHSETTNIVTQIPFIQKQNNSIVNQLSNVNENLIDTPFVEITRNIPYYANDIFGKATIVFNTVGSVTGYCEISDIQLITTATNEEKEQIESILKDGIFIKESEV